MDVLHSDNVIKYFKEISKIPRETCKEKQISDYLVDFAKKRNLEVRQDKLYNVIIKKKSNIKNYDGPTVILQGHMDMVYEKDANSDHLYESGIKVVEKDGFLYADHTTLGADNGIAVAYCLAILDQEEMKHPNLEVLFTVQEEGGMVGVKHIDLNDIKGKFFINIDTEEEGVLFTGCAGGVRNYIHIPSSKEKIKSESIISIEIKGLKGGHSGMEIGMGRGNAIKLLGRLLYKINNDNLHLCLLQAKGKANAISHYAKAVINVPKSDRTHVTKLIKDIENIFKNELQFTDNIKIDINELNNENYIEAYTKETKNKLINILMLLPSGEINKSQVIKDLVQTSMNVGSVEEIDNKISILNFIRSSVESEKYSVADNVQIIADTCGAECEFFNDYPQWEYKVESKVRDTAIEIYEEIFNKKPLITAVHAGLECGYINKKLKDVDMISFGPDQYDVHTTNEHISIQSIKNVWVFLLKLLERLAKEKD